MNCENCGEDIAQARIRIREGPAGFGLYAGEVRLPGEVGAVEVEELRSASRIRFELRASDRDVASSDEPDYSAMFPESWCTVCGLSAWDADRRLSRNLVPFRYKMQHSNVRGQGAGLYIGPYRVPLTITGYSMNADVRETGSVSGYRQYESVGSHSTWVCEVYHPGGAGQVIGADVPHQGKGRIRWTR